MWAVLITAVAIGVPSVAWYIAGSRAVAQEARRIEQAPRMQAQREAERIARGLAVRLESLRRSETRRSYLDYEPHVHEEHPDECGCEPRLISPLARGPADPLVWAHFQMDEVGQLELPSLEARAVDLEARRALSDERAILEVLECAAAGPLAQLPTPSANSGEEVQGLDSEWVVTVGSFQWHSVSLEGQPVLVALRQVSTPTANLTQGFVVQRAALDDLLHDAPYPAQLKPGPPENETEVRIPIEGEPWTVAVDAGAAMDAAAARAGEARVRFRTNFAIGLLGAMLGGALVVGLVRQAERLARQRAQFAAAAAHELRTPLAGLRMYGEMLADESGDPAHRRAYARRVAGEAERLGRVVGNLLGFSKLERGELKLHPEDGDLAAAVHESLGRLAPALEADGATIETSIAETLPRARFDRDAVHQILQNLLDNAASHGRADDDPMIRIVLERGDTGPCLSVIDHGPGVAPALQDKLFLAFVRHASPGASDGLGLGLALVRALALAQNASVDYADESGGGSRFTVTFPAA